MPIESVSSDHFVTTTSILKHLNDQISDYGEFELHTRMPDGSSRSATTAEQSSADFQAKLQQAVVHVQSLTTEDDRIAWANEQNALGNHLFQKEKRFEEAVDVYLTCLAVTAELKSTAHAVLFAKVMNNLASCTLQLQWYRKTMHFCSMALDQLHKADAPVLDKALRVYCAKLYFKRSKAGRLRGDYSIQDLKIARRLIENESEELRAAVAKEEQLLKQAMTQAAATKISQQKALQKQFGEDHGRGNALNTTHGKDSAASTSLYEESHPKTRQFSTIRAPTHKEPHDAKISYWTMYRERISKQIRKLFSYKDD